jgi:hypothetical protein
VLHNPLTTILDDINHLTPAIRGDIVLQI